MNTFGAHMADMLTMPVFAIAAQQQSGTNQTIYNTQLISVSGTKKLALAPLVEHYLKGDATDYTLSDEEFNKFVAEMKRTGG